MTKLKRSPPKPLRRFTRGDGVRLTDDRVGVIQSVSMINENFEYIIKVKDTTDFVFVMQDALISEPSLNTGKYGGPSRGGAAGGWVGGNNYRKR